MQEKDQQINELQEHIFRLKEQLIASNMDSDKASVSALSEVGYVVIVNLSYVFISSTVAFFNLYSCFSFASAKMNIPIIAENLNLKKIIAGLISISFNFTLKISVDEKCML